MNEIKYVDNNDIANKEWFDKTAWVQTDFQAGKFPLARLGQHRADIMLEEICRLRNIVKEYQQYEVVSIISTNLEEPLVRLKKLTKDNK